MSHIITNRLFKPSVCRNFLRHINVRLFTSDQPYPFVLVDHILKNPDTPDGIVQKGYPYNTKEKKIFITDEKVEKKVRDAMTVGCSRDGLQVLLKAGPTICYKDVSAYLPPLPAGSQIQSLAMSSLPVRDKDWRVCVKLSGSRLSLCRPFGNCKWIDVKKAPGSINPLASLMFSKTDDKFYIPSPGGSYLCALEKYTDDQLEFIDMDFDHLPASVHEEVAELSSCSRTDHLVESPTGQLFLIKWYGKDSEVYVKDSDWNLDSDLESDSDSDFDDSEENEEDGDSEIAVMKHVTKKFLVFRAGEQSYLYKKTMIYTEDIGDLCIFLGHGEASCVPASSSPGLKPNCIYFVGPNFGVYDLTTKTCTTFHNQQQNPVTKAKFPYWSPVPL